jgi:hypothetical protein
MQPKDSGTRDTTLPAAQLSLLQSRSAQPREMDAAGRKSPQNTHPSPTNIRVHLWFKSSGSAYGPVPSPDSYSVRPGGRCSYSYSDSNVADTASEGRTLQRIQNRARARARTRLRARARARARTTHNAQRTTHNASRTTHHAPRTTHIIGTHQRPSAVQNRRLIHAANTAGRDASARPENRIHTSRNRLLSLAASAGTAPEHDGWIQMPCG